MRVKLQRLREAKGFTQQELADMLGISRTHYGQIESAARNPRLDYAAKIKKILGTTSNEIFEVETETPATQSAVDWYKRLMEFSETQAGGQ